MVLLVHFSFAEPSGNTLRVVHEREGCEPKILLHFIYLNVNAYEKREATLQERNEEIESFQTSWIMVPSAAPCEFVTCQKRPR